METESIVASVLTEIYQEGPDVFLSAEQFAKKLTEKGLPEITVEQLLLMTRVTGFWELIRADESTKYADFERYMNNAFRETGLTRMKILELGSELGCMIGIPLLQTIRSEGMDVEDSEKSYRSGYTIPAALYQAELEEIEKLIEEKKLFNLTEEEILRLQVLASSGVPRAKYYYGMILMKQENELGTEGKGFQMILDAAAEGDACAAGVLGDHYYKQESAGSWTKAFEYYIDYGAMPLNESRKEAVRTIMNAGAFNKALVTLCCVFAIFLCVLAFLIPSILGATQHRVLFVFMVTAMLAGIVLSYWQLRENAYDNIWKLPVLIFVLWTLYLSFCLLT